MKGGVKITGHIWLKRLLSIKNSLQNQCTNSSAKAAYIVPSSLIRSSYIRFCLRSFDTPPSAKPLPMAEMIIKADFYFATAFLLLSYLVFFITVIVGLDPTIQKTQGTASRYARRKQRASTKVLKTAGNADEVQIPAEEPNTPDNEPKNTMME